MKRELNEPRIAKIAARKSGVGLLPGGKRQPSVSDSGAFCERLYTLGIFLHARSFFSFSEWTAAGGHNYLNLGGEKEAWLMPPGGGISQGFGLEVELQRELNLARIVQRAYAVPHGKGRRAERENDTGRRAGVDVVEDIEELRTELHVELFRDLRVLQDREIKVAEEKTGYAVSLNITYVPGSLRRVTVRIKRSVFLELSTCGWIGYRSPLIQHLVKPAVIRPAHALKEDRTARRERVVRPRGPLRTQVARIEAGNRRVRDVGRSSGIEADDRGHLPAFHEPVPLKWQGIQGIRDQVVADVEVAVPVIVSLIVGIRH